jgi:small GTP-binding protein
MVTEASNKETIKIVILGLDNCGKTSISLILQRKNKLSYFTSLSPTRGYETQFFTDKNSDSDFVIWDLGGQEQHRDAHLKNFLSEYMVGSNKLIFVIDIQDIKRYDLALDYLNKVIIELKRGNIKVKLSIFLHKFDSDLDLNEATISGLKKKIKEIISNDFEYNMYITSIYAVFKRTLTT